MARIGPNANPRRQWNIQRPHQDSDKAWKLTQEQGDVFRNHHVQVPCEFSGQKRASNKEVAIWYTVHSCVQTYVRKWLDVIITAICLCKDLWFALSLVSVQLGILLEWDSENPSVCCDFKGLSAGKNKKNQLPWSNLPGSFQGLKHDSFRHVKKRGSWILTWVVGNSNIFGMFIPNFGIYMIQFDVNAYFSTGLVNQPPPCEPLRLYPPPPFDDGCFVSLPP